ncbi:MAG: LysR family transcriptional regulator [Pseudomonadota bacterium]
MYDLKPIRVFLEVATLKSFAAAAKSLNMTPASVTRIIAKLEADFGRQLLLRTTRQVSLTSTGALVASRYSPLVKAFDQVEEELGRDLQPFKGHLKVNAPMSFGLRLMPDFLDRFRVAYPDIDLHIHLTDSLIDVVNDRCDLAIRISGSPDDKSTIWRKLCKVRMLAVASPKLLANHGQPETPDALDRRLCLSYGHTTEREVWRFQKGSVKRPVTASGAIHSNNGDLLYQMVKRGFGIAVLPEFHASHGIEQGDIVEILNDWEISPLWLSLFYPPYETLPPLVATFTEFFEAYLSDLPGFDI